MGSDLEITRVHRTQKEAQAAYDKMSRWYDLISGSSERRFAELGLKKLNIAHGERILEIGCGTGHSLVSISHQVGEKGVTCGADLSFGMCLQSKARIGEAPIVLNCADALNLPFESHTFDSVFMSFVLELFDTPEIPLALAECRRILKPDGRLGCVVLSKTSRQTWMVDLYERLHNRFPAYVDCRPIFGQKALADAGFEIAESETLSMWGLPVEIILAKNPGLVLDKKPKKTDK